MTPDQSGAQPRGETAEIAARLSAIETEIRALDARLDRNEASLSDLHRSRMELSQLVASLSQRFAQRSKHSATLPKPLRVLRKRLRAMGILPAVAKGVVTYQGHENPMAWALREAPSALKPYLTPKNPYEAWIDANRPTQQAEADSSAWLTSVKSPPTISIITPVYNTSPKLLKEMVSSVVAQTYPHWELCCADDSSTSSETVEALKTLAVSDPRIRVIRREVNGGISAATNSAVEIAQGEIIAFLDHDDLLTPDALMEVAAYYSQHPEADLVYSDDDKISENGERYAPQFKPDWSPVLHLSYMYMSHLLTVRRELFLDVGGFRSEFDGSQDYDFALRASEIARHVGHIPRILYHWRAVAGSTAVSGDAKPGSFEAGRKAVSDALARRGIEGRVSQPDWAVETCVGMFSVAFPDSGPAITIIVPTYNNVDLLRDCLESLSLTTYTNYEVLVIDNGSDEAEARAYLKDISERPRHRVVRIPQRPTGFSFAALMNEAVTHAHTPFVLFLNNDTRVISPSWLSQMAGYAQMPNIGAVGARLYFGDGTIQHAGIVHGYNEGLVGHAFRGAPPHDWGYMGFIRTAREYSAVTAACMLTPLAQFRALGGFDEKNFAVAYNDVDYSYRLVEAGLNCVYCPEAELFHFEGKTRGFIDNPKELIAFREIYGAWNDRWYNPNLSLESEDFKPSTRRLPSRQNRPVRVAAITHNLRLEGAPNTLFDLLVGLKEIGAADPIVFAPSDGPLRDRYAAAGIEVRLCQEPGPGTPLEVYDGVVEALASKLAIAGGEVVIANTLTTYYAVDAAARVGLATIWCQHESEPWDTYFDALNPQVRVRAYAAFGQAYRVTYVAEATRRAWSPVHTRSNTQVIRHGIPPQRLAEEVGRWAPTAARAAVGAQAGDLVLIAVGTVCRRKGQLDLVEALAKLPLHQVEKIRVYIAGALVETDYAEQVSAAIGALDPHLSRRVELVGPVPDMTVYYAAADIFVCTSRIESAPRVIVEAMAFALPIITTPVFGIPELVAMGVNALSYEPGDTATLASLIDKLIDDEALRLKLGGNGLDVLNSRPGYQGMMKDYASLISECLLLKTELK